MQFFRCAAHSCSLLEACWDLRLVIDVEAKGGGGGVGPEKNQPLLSRAVSSHEGLTPLETGERASSDKDDLEPFSTSQTIDPLGF